MNARCTQDTAIKYQSLTQRLSRLSSKLKPSSIDNISQSVCTTKRTFEKGKNTHVRMKTDTLNSERKQSKLRKTLPSEKAILTNVQLSNIFKREQHQKFRYQRSKDIFHKCLAEVKSLTRIKRVNRNGIGY